MELSSKHNYFGVKIMAAISADPRTLLRGILTAIEDHNHVQLLVNLYSRWQDEKEYEDFAEYEKVVISRINYLPITRVTKRPFGFKVSLSIGREAHVHLVKKGRNHMNIAAKLL
jgi:hypothetical protein